MNDSLQKIVNENEYEVRFNTIEDQEQMAHIKVEGWQDAYHDIIDKDYLNNLNYKEQTERYIDSFQEYKDKVLVVENKQTKDILGYSCFSDEKTGNYDSELVSLYIKPEYKGRGIGTLLFNETVNYLKDKNNKNMILWCIKDNIKSVEFYQKLGCEIKEDKIAKIGNKEYPEYGFVYEIKKDF